MFWLQWGHALSSVETGVYVVAAMLAGIRFNGATLSQAWKHLTGPCRSIRDAVASIGRRSLKVGNSRLRPLPSAMNALQWGHALSSVETSRAAGESNTANFWLQWGHALSSVETRHQPFDPHSSAELQWGHALSSV